MINIPGFSRFLTCGLLIIGLMTGIQPAIAFSHSTLVIRTHAGSHKFNVELAVSEGERAQGLMFRKEMARDAGMLFIYNQEQPVTFWMKNTYLPLDMIFIAGDGKITRIVKSAEPLSEGLIPSGGPIRGVLEVNAGVAEQYEIQPGDQIVYSTFTAPASANSKTPGQ